MSDHSREIMVVLLGAVGGAVAGYLLFAERGRTLRRDIEAALEDTAEEINGFRTTVEKAAEIATRGWTLLNEAFGETGMEHTRYPAPRQTAPF